MVANVLMSQWLFANKAALKYQVSSEELSQEQDHHQLVTAASGPLLFQQLQVRFKHSWYPGTSVNPADYWWLSCTCEPETSGQEGDIFLVSAGTPNTLEDFIQRLY